jgi:hypothetical protein
MHQNNMPTAGSRANRLGNTQTQHTADLWSCQGPCVGLIHILSNTGNASQDWQSPASLLFQQVLHIAGSSIGAQAAALEILTIMMPTKQLLCMSKSSIYATSALDVRAAALSPSHEMHASCACVPARLSSCLQQAENNGEACICMVNHG